MMWQRIVFGASMIVAVVGLVWLDAWLAGGTYAPAASATALEVFANLALRSGLPLVAFVTVLAAATAFEMGRMCRISGLLPLTGWAMFTSAGLAAGPWLGMLLKEAEAVTPLPFNAEMPLTLFWLTGSFLGAALLMLGRRTTEKTVSNLATTMLIVLYSGLLGSFVIRVRCLDPGPAGSVVMVYFMLCVKSADIGAYFVGKFFGKNKLAPWVSPAKTVEGFLGAMAVAFLIACSAFWVKDLFADGDSLFPGTFPQVIAFAVVMAITGHLGDLLASSYKRDVGLKDSADLVPSFGGIMDIVDSPLLAAPFAWGLLTFWGSMD